MIHLNLQNLQISSSVRRFIIAYSGGLDSHVLLHLLANIRNAMPNIEVLVVHIDHGLSVNAESWVSHCAKQCLKLVLPYQSIKIDATPKKGESPEAAARVVRYQALASIMREGDCLLTAHHQDDQAETLLIQLLRGSGLRGLASMPVQAKFSLGWHVRPLLEYSRNELEVYAQQHGLNWINDESNSDCLFDRNFLRHEILPLLRQRFPALGTTLSRSARHCAEAAELLAHSAKQDIKNMILADETLSIKKLKGVGEVRGRNILMEWIRERKQVSPTSAQLQRIWDDVICASVDSNPIVKWSNVEVRRYRDALFVDKMLTDHNVDQCLMWDTRYTLEIQNLGVLSTEKKIGAGVAISCFEDHTCEIRFRQGGERIRPAGRTGHHALKKLFQEAGIPPWQRDRIPLLYHEDRLLAVAGFWVSHEAVASINSPGILLIWTPQA